MDESIQSRYHNIQDLAEQIVEQLREEVMRLGFPSSEVHIKQPHEARFRLEKDPGTGEYALVGDWFDERGAKLGCLLFHADGSFFVEHDVVKPHPSKRQWFVEAVNAWGKGKLIKAEVRLLPQPE